MEFWSVQFREFLEFKGVKEGIREVKKSKKERLKQNGGKQFGLEVEEVITNIVSQFPGFEIKELPPQMDIQFGADIQVSYKEGDKNYSFFADITTNEKPIVQYLTAMGNTTNKFEEAFCYHTEYFNIRFGLKEKHYTYFFYEKPVIVLQIENFTPTTGLALHHINNIGNIMISLNSLLVSMAYGARASQKVRPNPRRYYDEYTKYKESTSN